MIVFHGGFSKSQINKLKTNKFVLYRKENIENFRINWSNTFQYYNIENCKKRKLICENIIDQNYLNQWIHCYKYLYNATDFCNGPNNYIVAFELEDEILNEYIGVGKHKYEGYKVEYRIPRRIIDKDNIIDIVRYDLSNKKKFEPFKEKYNDQYYELKEHEEAIKILKKTKQKCKYI